MTTPAKQKRTFTVKKTLGGPMNFRKYEDFQVGDITIGEFVGTHLDQYKKTNYKIKVLDAQWEDADAGEALVGKVLVFNSCGSLDKQMEQVNEGTCVQIEYTGKTLLVKGPYAGKEAHGVIVSEVEMTEGEDEVDGL